MLTKSEARSLLLSLPGAEERPHYGKPAIFVKGEFVTRVHDREEAVVIITGGIEMRDVMLEAEPALFYITDHYRSRPALLARLGMLNRATLRQLVLPRIKAIEAAPEPRPKRKAKKRKR